MLPFYENVSYDLLIYENTSMDFPQHLHNAIELFWVESGQIEMGIGSDKKVLNSGDFAISFPNMIHDYHSLAEDNHVYMALCHLGLVGDYLGQLTKYHPKEPVIRAEALHPDVPYALEGMLKQRMVQHDRGVYRAFTQLILARILPQMELQRNSDFANADLTSRVIEYISQNYQQSLSLDELAHAVGVSKYQLSRVFSNRLNTSFPQYINSLRLITAQYLLRNTDLDILQISLECGFESQRTFNRVFKEMTGITPRDFRSALTS